MALTLQEKLALALTSAGSQRALARQLGVTHQKVGRWLREGEEGGVQAIPRDFFVIAAIDEIYRDHVAVTRAQAKRQDVPFNARAPVYVERKYLSKTGKKGERILGDRVISGNTEFIRQELRAEWLAGAVESKRFYKVNVRSRINLKRYSERIAAEEIASGRRRGVSQRKLAGILLENFVAKERYDKHRIVDKTEPFNLYTPSLDMRPGTDPRNVIFGVEEILSEKHEPATGDPGTHLASEYLLQLLPPPLHAAAKTAAYHKAGKARPKGRGKKPRK